MLNFTFLAGDSMEYIHLFFAQFRDVMTTKVLIQDRKEQIVLVDKKDKYHFCPYKVYSKDLATSAIDFAYDVILEKVLYYLLHSKDHVHRLKQYPNDAKAWEFLHTLANALNRDDNLHPYYYPLLSAIVNLYKRSLCDENGYLIDDNYLVNLGHSYIQLQETIREFLDACSRDDENEKVALEYYLNRQYREVEIRKIVLDLIPTKMYESEVVKAAPAAVLHPETPMDIWNYLLPEYIRSNLIFRRCNNCLRYFATTGVGNPKYCDRIVEGTNKTCRLLVAKEKAHVKNTTNPINILFNRTYKTMYSRVSAKRLDKEKFHQWAKDARQVRERCEAGIISLEDFADWLENSRNAKKYR